MVSCKSNIIYNTMVAAFSAESSTKQYGVRCISLPAARSYPVAMKIEHELNKLKSWEISSSSSSNGEKICLGVAGLGELYRCIGEFLGLPLTREALAQHQHENCWVNELLDGLLLYLDICGSTRDVVLMIKQSVRELQSALRRSKVGDFTIDGSVNAYICSRKKMNKEITKCLASLKQMEYNTFGSSRVLELNDHLALLIQMLRKVSRITTCNFNSLLQFLSVPTLKPKSTKWSMVLKQLVHKDKSVATFEGQWEANEFEDVDIALSNVLMMRQSSCKDDDEDDDEAEIKNIESAQEKLEALDGGIEGFENALECLFRRLIQTRVSLLNVLSQ